MVHEADKSSGDRIQQIDIYLKYVGKLDVPMPKLTPEQIKEEDRKRRKHAWNRTYARRKYECVFIVKLNYPQCSNSFHG